MRRQIETSFMKTHLRTDSFTVISLHCGNKDRPDDQARRAGSCAHLLVASDTMTSAAITDCFHDLYYQSEVWQNTYWRNTPVLKCPFDLWIYQELIFKLQPDLIVECGTWAGGSSLFMAHMPSISSLANRL
jgi:cephalosporin hydroxylase